MTHAFLSRLVFFSLKTVEPEGKLKNQIKDHLSVGHSGQKDN